MPDDTPVAEQELSPAEFTPENAEMASGFDIDPNSVTVKPKGDPQSPPPPEPAAAAPAAPPAVAPETPPVVPPVAPAAAPAAEELSAEEKALADRAATFKAEPEPTPPATPPAPPAPPQPAKAVSEPPAELKDILALPGLKDATVSVVGDDGQTRQMTMPEFAAEYPEIAQSSATFGRAIAQQQLEQAIQSGRVVSAEKVAGLVETMARLEYQIGVQSKHPDFIGVSATPEFDAWLQKQPAGVKAMMGSRDYKDGIYIIDAYKAQAARAAKKAAASVQQGELARQQQIHGETAAGKGAAAGAGGKPATAKSEFEAGWEAGGQ